MRLNTSKISFFTLSLLLPFAHIQGYLAGSGAIPLIRGQSILFLIITIVMCILIVKNRYALDVYILFLIFFLMIGYCLIIVFSDPFIYDYLGKSAFIVNLSVLFYYVVFFIVGFFLNNLELRKRWIFFFELLLIINLFFHFDFQSMGISLIAFNNDSKGIYLFLGDSFALWSILVFSLIRERPFINLCFFIITVISLFLFITRTSLYAFILVTPLIIFFTKKSLRYYLLLFVSVPFIYSSEFFANIKVISLRMFAFENINNDPSLISRNYLYNQGILAIKQNWVIGDYSGQLRISHLGAYIHNYLSLWRQFGLFPFISFCILTFFYICKSWYIFKSFKKNKVILPEDFFLIVGGFYCLIEIIAARSYTAPYIWLFIGMACQKKKNMKLIISN